MNYFEDKNHMDFINETRLKQWFDKVDSKEEISPFFDEYNTIWGPIRLRDITVESRNADVNLLSVVLGFASLYKGVYDYVKKNQLEVKVNNSNKLSYGLSDSKIIIPSYPLLKKLESNGARHGLKSDIVHAYLSYLTEIAIDGLQNEEKQYLKPIQIMLNKKQNVADLIYNHAKSLERSYNGTICSDTAKQTNLFINRLYENDLKNKTYICDALQSLN